MMIRHGDLNTKTEMSGSIFLELRSDLPQTVYISEGSTAGRELTVRPTLDRQLVDAGFKAGIGAALATDFLSGSDVAAEIGLAVAVVAFLLDAKTKHIAHTLTTDVLVTETIPDGAEGTHLRYHDTQIVSGVSTINLKLEEGLPAMIGGLSRSLAGLLPRRAQGLETVRTYNGRENPG